MPKGSVPYESFLHPQLQEDAFAIGYLNQCLGDEDPRVFLSALRQVAEARGLGMKELAEKAGLNRESLYRTLSRKGNPEWKTLHALLSALGLKMAIQQEAS